ncbi:MAG TPA: hypothetical protein VF679_01440, partial [Pedobacter sp.]
MKTTQFKNVALCTTLMLAMSACSWDSKTAESPDTTSLMTDTTLVTETEKGTLDDVKPIGPVPAWGPGLKPQMQVVMEKLASYKDTPIPQLTAVEARQ